jgi:hypothetical protein
MANTAETLKVVDRDRLPDSVADAEGFRIEEGRLVRVDDQGNTHRVDRVGALAFELLRTSGMAEDVSLETQIHNLSQQLEQALAVIETQGERIASLSERLDATDPMRRSFELNERVRVKSGELTDGEDLIEDNAKIISGVWIQEEEGEDVEYVTVDRGGEIMQIKLQDLREWQTRDISWPSTSNETPSPPTKLTRRDRVMMPLNNAVTGVLTRRLSKDYVYDDRGRVVQEVEVKRGVNPIAAIGGVALAGVLGWWLASKTGHSHHDVVNNYYNGKPAIVTPEQVVPVPSGVHNTVNSISGSGWDYIAPPASTASADKLQFYNDGIGNHGFAVDLSHAEGFDMKGVPGDYTVIGPGGVSVEHIGWKGNGPLSNETIRRLKEAFPNLKFRLGDLFYKSPGSHGWVKHYVSALSYK